RVLLVEVADKRLQRRTAQLFPARNLVANLVVASHDGALVPFEPITPPLLLLRGLLRNRLDRFIPSGLKAEAHGPDLRPARAAHIWIPQAARSQCTAWRAGRLSGYSIVCGGGDINGKGFRALGHARTVPQGKRINAHPIFPTSRIFSR